MSSSTTPSATDPGKTYSLWWVFILAAVVGFAFQGSRGLSSSTEGRYAESGREMLVSGNYLEPTLSGKPHWTKPPLTYAAIAASLRVLGNNAWAIRTPNAIAFIATALAVAGLGTALWDKRTGFIAGVVYASSPFAISGSHSVSTDTLLTLFETLAMLCYVRAWAASQADDRKRAQRNVVAMYFWFGVAFLTKGPPALLPLAALLPWHLRQSIRPRLASAVGIGTGLVVGGSWFAVVIARHPEVLEYFIGEEVIARVATDDARRNPEWWKPFAYFIPPLALGTLPWTILFFAYAGRESLWNPRVLLRRLRAPSVDGLLLFWLLIPLAVFFLSKSRLVLYVLPLCVPVALAVARVCSQRLTPRVVLCIAWAMQCIHVTNKAVYAQQSPERNDQLVAELAAPFVVGKAPTYIHSESRHGVEFYLEQCMDRFSVEDELPDWADVSLSTLLLQLDAGEQRTPLVLIAPKDAAPQVEGMLREAGLRYWTASNEYHTAWKVLGASPLGGMLP